MITKSLSVIIPGYKTPAQWWERCVLSVLNAVREKDEIICVDDGTPNGTPILDELKKKDSRIKVIYKENGGLASARNIGLSNASGDFVTFVDSDDEVYSNIFRVCLEKIESLNADIALYGVKTIWVDEKLYKEDVPPAEILGELAPLDVKNLSDKCVMNYAWNKVYRRSFLDKNNLRFNLKGMPCEDIVFNLECIMDRARWVMIDQVGYVYYRTEGTLLSQYRPFNSVGLHLGAETWAKYVKTSKIAEELFGGRGMQGKGLIAWSEWDNLWRLNSPYSINKKLRWLQDNRQILLKSSSGIKAKILTFSPLVFVLYQSLYSFLRRYFYFKFIRQWHIKRMYPYAKVVK